MVATIGGRYALDGRLGEGGMGQVYRARHLQLGKPYALKIMSPEVAINATARARFNQEAKLASEIKHPNIVEVVDFGEDPQYGAFMVMELVEGESLINESATRMAVQRVVDILGQVADALDYIHRRGIIHGDVKADNIMLTHEVGGGTSAGARRRRLARLLDFGLARHVEHGGEEEVSGSPHYLAPERCAGGPPSIAGDIYALGVLGYLLLTGTLPFDGEVMDILSAHVHRLPDPPSQRRGELVDEGLEALIMRALAKDPAERHGTAAAFRAELNTVADMLDMGRRRRNSLQFEVPTTPRESMLVSAFERSRVAQALISLDGRIEFANPAFGRLIGVEDVNVEGLSITETTLSGVLPGFMRALKAAHVDGKPTERRARVFRGEDKPALELHLWICPLPIPGAEIHLMVRSEEEDPRRRARDGY